MGRRRCGMAEAAAAILQEGGTAAATLQDGGGLGASLLPYSVWGELVAGSVVWRAGGGNGGGGSTGRRKRRRRFCKTAETAAAILQEGSNLGASPLPLSSSLQGDTLDRGSPLSLSREYGKVTSTYHCFFISKA